MTEFEFRTFCQNLPAPNPIVLQAAYARLDSLTKPTGSLGHLEKTAAQYAAARHDLFAEVSYPTLLNFAADHGVAEEGVSAYPQSVTRQMVHNFSQGGAAINVLTHHHGIRLILTDIGVIGDCTFPHVRNRKVRESSRNLARGPALTQAETLAAINVGIQTALEAIDDGTTLIAAGEMGIANTTPAAALFCVLLDLPPEIIVGRGTGINDTQLERKIKIVRKGLEINTEHLHDPFSTLAAVGGLDIAAMCGAILGAASRHVPTVTDGFISGAAALMAVKLAPQIQKMLFFGHCSVEQGHARFISEMQAFPLLDLHLRLGEGTGAALAIPLISAASALLRQMATFDEAAVCGEKV